MYIWPRTQAMTRLTSIYSQVETIYKVGMKPSDLLCKLKDKTWDHSNPRICNRKLLLTYDEQISYQSILKLLNGINGMECEHIHVGYENTDDGIVTHVAVDFGRMLNIKNSSCMSIFDIVHDGNSISPRIRTMGAGKHWDDAVTYVTKYCMNSTLTDNSWFSEVIELIEDEDMTDKICWIANMDGIESNISFIDRISRDHNYLILNNINNSNTLKNELLKLIPKITDEEVLVINIIKYTTRLHRLIESIIARNEVKLSEYIEVKIKIPKILVLSDRQIEGDRELYKMLIIADGEVN
jgi:hypothetical protein